MAMLGAWVQATGVIDGKLMTPPMLTLLGGAVDAYSVWLEIVKTVPIVLTIVITAWLQLRKSDKNAAKIDQNTELTNSGFSEAARKIEQNTNLTAQGFTLVTKQGDVIHDAVNGNLAKVNKRLDETTERLDRALKMIDDQAKMLSEQAKIIESMRVK